MANRGRTVAKYVRVYVDGYDVSGNTRSIGPAAWTFPQVDCGSLADILQGYLPGQPDVNVGALNAIYDNTANTGIQAVGSSGPGTTRSVIIAQGIRADPAIGNPALCGQFVQSE